MSVAGLTVGEVDASTALQGRGDEPIQTDVEISSDVAAESTASPSTIRPLRLVKPS